MPYLIPDQRATTTGNFFIDDELPRRARRDRPRALQRVRPGTTQFIPAFSSTARARFRASGSARLAIAIRARPRSGSLGDLDPRAWSPGVALGVDLDVLR